MSTNATAARREQVAPLLASGLSIRAIARRTGIPQSAVGRAKTQIEKAQATQVGEPTSAKNRSGKAPDQSADQAGADRSPHERGVVTGADVDVGDAPLIQGARSSEPNHKVCAYCGSPGHVGYGVGDLLPAQIRGQSFVVHSRCFGALTARIQAAPVRVVQPKRSSPPSTN
jgi:hypothetical protein